MIKCELCRKEVGRINNAAVAWDKFNYFQFEYPDKKIEVWGLKELIERGVGNYAGR